MSQDAQVSLTAATAVVFVIELFRAENTAEPYRFDFKTQKYYRRLEDGAIRGPAELPWDGALFDDLTALSGAHGSRDAARKLGQTLRRFLGGLGWDADEAAINGALAEGKLVEVALRLEAAELAALPWEVLTLDRNLAPLCEMAGVTIRYQWTGTETAKEARDPPPEGGRALFAYSAAGGAIPADMHIRLLNDACNDGNLSFDQRCDVLAGVSYQNLCEALAEAERAKRPFRVLHLLCHGGQLDDARTFGLVWNGDNGESGAVLDGATLATLLRPHGKHIRLIVVSACFSADQGALGNAVGSVAQELHRAGIEAVVASRFPLSIGASIAMTEALYYGLTVDLLPLEGALDKARGLIQSRLSGTDHLSLQLYAREADRGSRPFVMRPYRGLRAFRTEDARFFFGRKAETKRLYDRLKRHKLFALVGSSGSGKSSLAMAGLVPAIEEDAAREKKRVTAQVLRPGEWPCRALAEAILSAEGDNVGKGAPGARDALQEALKRHPESLTERALETMGHRRLVLVVDQVEELFTQSDPKERAAFVQNLLHATDTDTLQVILTLRADFLGHCLDHSQRLAERIQASHDIVLPMNEKELREAIEEPAKLVGLVFEPGLVEDLIKSVRERDRAGSLPLVGFALETLWERRRGRELTWNAWRDIGGIEGAVKGRARRVFAQSKSDAQKKATQKLFRRLIHVSEGAGDTRRVATKEELLAVAPDLAGPILDQWVGERLLTAGERDVWIAHEALIEQWMPLKRWIAEYREAIRVQHELNRTAKDWRDRGKSADELWRGGRLKRALELDQAEKLLLSREEREFFDTSAAEERRVIQAKEAENERERRNLRRLFWTAVVGVVTFAVLGGLAFQKQQAADRAAEKADLAAQKATSLAEKADAETKHARDASLISGAREQLALGQAQWAAQLALEVKDPQETQGWRGLIQQIFEHGMNWRLLPSHSSQVMVAAWSPTGEHVFTSSTDGSLLVWNIGTRELPLVLRRLDTGSAIAKKLYVTQAAWSPDGKRIVTVSAGKIAMLWNVGSSAGPIVLNDNEDEVETAAWNADGKRIITASDGKDVRIWRVEGNVTFTTFKGGRGNKDTIDAQNWSPDGAYVVMASNDNGARIWTADGKASPVIFKGHKAQVVDAAWSPDGNRIVTASHDRTARLWNADGRGRSILLEGHSDLVYSASWSSDGKYVLTVSKDNTARVWDVDNKTAPIILKDRSATIRHAVWSPDSRHIVTFSTDSTARLWDPQGRTEPIILSGHNGALTSAAWSPDSKFITTASIDGTVRLWSAESNPEPIVLKYGKKSAFLGAKWNSDGKRIVVTPSNLKAALVWNANGKGEPVLLMSYDKLTSIAAWSPDQQHIVAASADKTAIVWRSDGKGEPIVFEGHGEVVHSALWSPDSKRVVTVSADKTARIWSVDGGAPPIVLEGHQGDVLASAWSPDGERVVTTSGDKTARIWSTRGGGDPIVLKGHESQVRACEWAPDGKRVATSSDDGTARIWDVTGGTLPIPLKGHTGPVFSVAWSRDGKRVVTASMDGTVRIWNADGKGESIILQCNSRPLFNAAWSPDGRQIAAAGQADTVCVWDADDKENLVVLKGHEILIRTVEWSPNSSHLVTAAMDGTVRIWTISIPLLQQRLREANADCLPPAMRVTYLGEPISEARTKKEACEQRQRNRQSGSPSKAMLAPSP